MTRGELAEWLAMIGIILAWWPFIFLGWTFAAYRYPLYVVSLAVLAGILVRRLARLEEGLRYSRRIMDMQQRMKYGPTPPFLVPPPPDEGHKKGKKGQ